MSRLLHSLNRQCASPSTSFPRALAHFRRSKSNSSGGGEDDVPHPRLIEIDLESSTTDRDPAVSGMHMLDDVIHSLILRRSAPDWLPFLPGYSYWVPPRRPSNIVEVVRKISAAKARPSPLSDDELMAVTSPSGWPSSNYFFQGSAPMYPLASQVIEVKVKLQENFDDESESESEDEED
ncbi:unnamed protein product [Cuscuta campestris]|uniref:Uncharacterized protein n=1 Tax=Cuscuta campestris TaxID=132261 RepID=A0A484L1N0_9ASTE|nr:unnamed protein product [Cuscuta campestris]